MLLLKIMISLMYPAITKLIYYIVSFGYNVLTNKNELHDINICKLLLLIKNTLYPIHR